MQRSAPLLRIEGGRDNGALPLYIHPPADEMKAVEQVHTEWLLAQELSCPETTSGYKRTTLQSRSFEGPVAGAAKSQYQQPAACSSSGLTQLQRQTLLLARPPQ